MRGSGRGIRSDSVHMGSPRAEGRIGHGPSLLADGEGFVRDLSADDTVDVVEGEICEGGSKGKGIPLVAAFGHVEDEDFLELDR